MEKYQTEQQQARITRAAQIVSLGGQIERIDDTMYHVKSQSNPDRFYEVISTEHRMLCSCPDSIYRGVCCKHVHAIEISRRMREAVQEDVPKTIIKQVDLGRCKRCDSSNIAKQGMRKLKRGPAQGYKCKDCGKRFTHNLGFEGKRAAPEQITQTVELVFSGLSSRKAATFLKKANDKVSHQTIYNWSEEYGNIMETYMDKIRPQVGEAWRTDEIYMSIKGNRRYLFAMLDSETRYWIAKQVAEHKGKDDVAPMFKQAKKVAGKIPTTLISDKAANFHHAWKEQYASKNFLHKQTWHINEVAFDGIHHNNQMESFNGNTVRLREDVIRSLKKYDSAILAGLRVYHNHVRPHLGLDGQMTPGEAAGITIEGNDKILTMIQAVAKSVGRTPLEGDRSAMHTLAVGGQRGHDRQEVTMEYGRENPYRTPDI